MIGFLAPPPALRSATGLHCLADSTGRLLASSAACAGGLLAATLVSPWQFTAREILLPLAGTVIAAIAMAMGFRALLVLLALISGAFVSLELRSRSGMVTPVDWTAGLVPAFALVVAGVLAASSLSRTLRQVRGLVLPAVVAVTVVLVWPLPFSITITTVVDSARSLAAGAMLVVPALVLAPVFSWLESARGMRAAGTIDVRDNVARLAGTAAALLAGLWITSRVGSVARQSFAGTPLEGLAVSAGWSAGVVVAALVVFAVWRMPRYFYDRQLNGRSYPHAVSDSIWFLLFAALTGTALDLAVAGPTLGWASWTVLAAAFTYGIVRVRLSAPQTSGAAPLWIVVRTRPPWIGRAVVNRLASAWRIGPVTIVAQPEAASLIAGAHLRASAATGRLHHLFPLRASHLDDWDDSLPPRTSWQALPVREIYPAFYLWSQLLGNRVTPGATVIAVTHRRFTPERVNVGVFWGPGGLRTLWPSLLGLAGLEGRFVAASEAATLWPDLQEWPWRSVLMDAAPEATADSFPDLLRRLHNRQMVGPDGFLHWLTRWTWVPTRHILVVHHGEDAEFARSLCTALMNRPDRYAPPITAWPVPIDGESWSRVRWGIVPWSFWRHTFRLAARLLSAEGAGVVARLSKSVFTALAARSRGGYTLAVLERESAAGGLSSFGEFFAALAEKRVIEDVIAVRSFRHHGDDWLLGTVHRYSSEIRWSAATAMSARCEEIAETLVRQQFSRAEAPDASAEPAPPSAIDSTSVPPEVDADEQDVLDVYIALMPEVEDFRGPLMDGFDHRRNLRRRISVVPGNYTDMSITPGAEWDKEIQSAAAAADDSAQDAKARLEGTDVYVLILGSHGSAPALLSVQYELEEVRRRKMPCLVFQRRGDTATPEQIPTDMIADRFTRDFATERPQPFSDYHQLLSQLFVALERVRKTTAQRTSALGGQQQTVIATTSDAQADEGGEALTLLADLRHDVDVIHAAFRPTGGAIITVDAESTARVLETPSFRETGVIMRGVRQAQFSPDGRLIATVETEAGATVWDAETGLMLAQMTPPEEIDVVSFSPDGSRLVIATREGTARVWESISGAAATSWTLQHRGRVLSAGFSPDGTRVLTSGEDRILCLWNTETGEQLAWLSHPTAAGVATFSPDGRFVATAGEDRKVRLWDAIHLAPLGWDVQHGGDVNQVVFSPDGTLVAAASDDGFAHAWETSGGSPRTLAHPVGVTAISFTQDSRRIATGCRDRYVRLWNARTGELVGQPFLLDGPVTRVEFSPDDGTLLALDGSRSVKLLAADSAAR